ncbi:MAG: glycosyltransferase [Armatimonadota bacterium]|nr:glycosyltransferase [Armatimonadota bacterium]
MLLVDYQFPPIAGSGVQRTMSYATHLRGLGWTPIVLTVREGEHGFHDTSMLGRIPAGVEVHRTAAVEPVRLAKRLVARRLRGAWDYGARSGRPLLRSPRWVALERWVFFPDRHLGWLPFGLARALAICRRRSVDVVHSTSTAITSHLIAYALKKTLGTPWIADFQDPWVDNPLPIFPSRVHRRLARVIESKIMHAADRVTVTTGAHREFLCEKFPALARKFVAIPIGFDAAAFGGVRPRRSEKFTVAHFGAFYGTRSPAAFLAALTGAMQASEELARDVEVWFFGTFDAAALAVVEEAKRVHGLEHIVRVHGVVPYREAVGAMVSADVLLLVHTRGLWGEKLVTSKVFEYLGAGRPILALTPPGETARIIGRAGAGIVVEPGDVGAIRDAILGLYARWRGGRLDAPPTRRVADEYSWRRVTARFAAVLDDVVSPTRSCP